MVANSRYEILDNNPAMDKTCMVLNSPYFCPWASSENQRSESRSHRIVLSPLGSYGRVYSINLHVLLHEASLWINYEG